MARKRRESIVTVTLNPAIDEALILPRLHVGGVNRVLRFERRAGGKGVNVASMLGQHGIPCVATGFLGRNNARLFEELFARFGIEDRFVRVAGETRRGIKLVEELSQVTTDLNSPGLEVGPEEFGELLGVLRGLAQAGRRFVVSGSLPPGVSARDFGGMVRMLGESGARVAVDTSGEALKEALLERVELVKPNEHELAEILGTSLPDFDLLLEAGARLRRESGAQVLLSLGERGAAFFAPDGALLAGPPPVEVVSTVGAGDALLAGYLAGEAAGMGLRERARLAAVFAWSALEDVSRELASAEEIGRRVERIWTQPLELSAAGELVAQPTCRAEEGAPQLRALQ